MHYRAMAKKKSSTLARNRAKTRAANARKARAAKRAREQHAHAYVASLPKAEERGYRAVVHHSTTPYSPSQPFVPVSAPPSRKGLIAVGVALAIGAIIHGYITRPQAPQA